MSSILYFTAKYLTLPGTLIKALWEHIMLRILKVRVEDTRYLQPNELCGHIEHALINGAGKSFMFCVFPGLVNFLLSVPMLAVSSTGLFYMGIGYRDIETGRVAPVFFILAAVLYFGLSLWCSRYPLYEDALHMWDMIYGSKETGVLFKVLAFIPSLFIMAGSFLERYGLNVIIAAAAVIVLFII